MTDVWHRSPGGSGGPTFAPPGITAVKAHSIPRRVTHCDHDGVPGGGEDVCVIVALVVLGELLGEGLASELREEAEGRLRSPHPGPGLNPESSALSCTAPILGLGGQPDYPLPVQWLLLGMVWNGRFQNPVWDCIGCFGRAETLRDRPVLPPEKPSQEEGGGGSRFGLGSLAERLWTLRDPL